MASTNPRVVAERDQKVVALYREGLSDPEIAARMGITQRTVQRAKRRQGIRDRAPSVPFTAEEDEIALRLLADGANYREVANTLDRCYYTVSERFRGQSRCTPAEGLLYREMLKMLEAL